MDSRGGFLGELKLQMLKQEQTVSGLLRMIEVQLSR